MLTKRDLKDIEKIISKKIQEETKSPNGLTTKSFVKKIENNLVDLIVGTAGSLDAKIEKTKQQLEEKIKLNHDEIIEKLDSISGMIKKFDEEHTLASYRISEHSDELEDHELRVGKLEKIHPKYQHQPA